MVWGLTPTPERGLTSLILAPSVPCPCLVWGLTKHNKFVILRALMPHNKKTLRKKGIVLETLPDTLFRVKLEDGTTILAHLAGKLRMYHIRVLPGDKVTVEMSPYDKARGRIVYRGK